MSIPPIVSPGNVLQRIRMPNAAGIAGQALRIASVAGTQAQAEWYNVSTAIPANTALGNFTGSAAEPTAQDKNAWITWLDVPTNSDSRLTNAREWIAATVDQAEAELGIGTDRRAWTALRVRQSTRVNPDIDPTGNIFTIGTGTNAQRIRLRRRFAGAGDFSQLSIDFSGDNCRIQTQQAGNTPNPLCLGTNGVDRVFLSATSTQLGIGGAPTTRPLEIFAGTAGFRLQSSSAVSPPVYSEIARTFDFLTWQDSTSPFNTCTDLVANSNQFNNHSLRVFVHTSGTSAPVLHSVFHSSGRLLVGTDVDNGTDRLQVSGGITSSQLTIGGSGSATSPLIFFNGAGTGNEMGIYRSGFDVAFASQGVAAARISYAAGICTVRDNHFGITSEQFNGVTAAADTRWSRSSAGVWRAGTTANNALGSVELANLTASGNVNLSVSGTILWGTFTGLQGIGDEDLVVRRSSVGTERVRFQPVGVTVANDGGFRFSSTVSATGTVNLALRSNAGVLEINNGTLGSLRDLSLRNITASGNVTASGFLDVTGTTFCNGSGGIRLTTRVYLQSPSDGVLTLTNNAFSNFTRLNLGPATSAFPAIRRNGTTAEIRLADDSAFAPLACSNITASGNATINGADQVLTLSSSTSFSLVRCSIASAPTQFMEFGRGGSRFQVACQGNIELEFQTNNTRRMAIAGTGEVSILSHVTSAFQSLSADPSTIDIGTGLHRVVKNTTSGEVRDWVNDGGVMKKSPAYT